MTILFFVAWSGFASWLTRRHRWPGESVSLPIFAFMIAALYIGGLLGVMPAVYYALISAGIVLLGIACRRAVRERYLPRPGLGLVLFAISVSAVLWQLDGAQFVGWDVFSHWGFASKEVVTKAALITADSPLLLKDYPPGASLFHYAVVGPGGFSEEGIYRAHFLLAASAVASLASGWRLWVSAAALLFGFSAAAMVAPAGVQALEVDHLLGLFFGCGIAGYLFSSTHGRVWRVAPLIFVLPLLKAAGILLGLVLGAVVAWDQIRTQPGGRLRFASLALLALPLLAAGTWTAHVKSISASQTFKTPSYARTLDSLTGHSASEGQRVIKAEFVKALSTRVIGDGVAARLGVAPTARGWALLWLVTAGLVLALLPAHERRRFVASQVWLVVGAVVWTGGLLVLYLNSFGEYEGRLLASFTRYMSVLVLGVGTVLFAAAVRSSRQDAKWRVRAGQMLVWVMTLGSLSLAPRVAFAFLWTGPVKPWAERRAVQDTLRDVIPLIDEEARVYLLWPASIGLEFHIARYELAPRRTNSSCWAVGPARFEGDVWTCADAVDSFPSTLANYDYLIVGEPNAAVWDTLHAVLPDGQRARLFKVNPHADGGVRLEPMK